MLRNKLKLKYGVNLKFETQIWKPGADLELKNLEMRSRIPGLNLEKNRLKPGKDRFLVYFKKSNVSGAQSRKNAEIVPKWFNSLDTNFNTCASFFKTWLCNFTFWFNNNNKKDYQMSRW